MILKKLNLKNCGNFNDVVYEFDNCFNLIYGKNETGKSTTQDSIIDALFGKVQNEKYSLVYGEKQLEINFDLKDEDKEFSFSQKSTFSQKTSRGEAKPYNKRKEFERAFLPNGVDKKFYQHIFALNHERLRSESYILFHQDTSITNLLFGAMSGSEFINTLPNTLEKSAKALFATSGNEPRISYIHKQIQKLKEDITSKQLNQGIYSDKLKDIDSNKENIKALETELKELESKEKELYTLLSNADIYFQIQQIKEQLKAQPLWKADSKILQKWASEYENYKELSTQVNTLKNQFNLDQKNLLEIHIDDSLVSHKDTIEKLALRSYSVKKDEDDMASKKLELESLVSSIQKDIKKLGIQTDTESISKQEIEALVSSEDIHQELQSILHRLEKDLAYNIPQNIDIQRVDEFKQKFITLDTKIIDLDKDKIKLETQKESLKKQLEQNHTEVSYNEFDTLKTQKISSWEVLKKSIPTIESLDDTKIVEFENIDNKYQVLVSEVLDDAQKYASQKIAIETISKIDAELQEIELKTSTFTKEKEDLTILWNQFLNEELHTSKLFTIDKLDEWNVLREKTQKDIATKRDLELEIEKLEKSVSVFKDVLQSLQSQLNITKSLNEIKKDLDENLQKKVTKTTLKNGLKSKEVNVSNLEEEQSKLKELLYQNLPEELKSKTLEEVIDESDKSKDYNTLKNQLTEKEGIFDSSLEKAFKDFLSKDDIQKLSDENLTNVQEKKTKLEEEKVSLSHKERNVEILLSNDEEINQNHQEIESLKVQLKDMVEKYIKFKVSALTIPKLINELSSENQEEILSKAKEYFKIFTNKNYTDLYVEENLLMATRTKALSTLNDEQNIIYNNQEDTITINHTQMSEGAKDQLFLSLRLAFVTLFNEKSEKKLPFLADDILINFDEDRIVAGLKLLKEFSQTTQVIFFTHSKRVKELYLNLE